MFDCEKIKLIIWDLDDTFWQGTLSEGKVSPVGGNIALIKKLTDRGIVNSVCSKNDYEKASKRLKEMNIWDYFVFPSINWEAKGDRIQKQIRDMKLRSENVLFLDDNPVNLNEAVFYNEGIMIGTPEDLPALTEYADKQEAVDLQHKRLDSYRILQTKITEQEKSGSNEEFLRTSNIKVTIHKDCMAELDRIAEMIQRTNQLNYTKKRISTEETRQLLEAPDSECGYVTAEDKYGSYGIVGFYAIRGERAEHFLFSCRTLGMGVEQYVYALLGSPLLETVGEVAIPLKKASMPAWINQDKELVTEGRASLGQGKNAPKILFKGPCDLNSIFAFLEESSNVECEFTYVSPKTGVAIEQINHSAHMVQALTLSKEQKEQVIAELPFADADMYSDKMYQGNYDMVFLSALADANLGVYRRKEGGQLTAFAEGYYPLTDSENREQFLNKEIYTAGCILTKEFLQWFSENYEFAGKLSAEQIADNFVFIREHLNPQTLMVILLGSEIPYEKNKIAAHEGRNLEHKKINEAIRKAAKKYENIICMETDRYVKGQESFYDQFNHFVPAVYYEMSKDIAKLVSERTNHHIETKSGTFMRIETFKENLRKIKHKIVK